MELLPWNTKKYTKNVLMVAVFTIGFDNIVCIKDFFFFYLSIFLSICLLHNVHYLQIYLIYLSIHLYTGWPSKNGTVDFLGLCSDEQLSFFTLLDRASFPHYNNTTIIKFGWELFYFMSNVLWTVIFGICHWFVSNRASELWKSANPENDSP